MEVLRNHPLPLHPEPFWQPHLDQRERKHLVCFARLDGIFSNPPPFLLLKYLQMAGDQRNSRGRTIELSFMREAIKKGLRREKEIFGIICWVAYITNTITSVKGE
jgi:hypothetical protein